jgi:hypothetical protein
VTAAICNSINNTPWCVRVVESYLLLALSILEHFLQGAGAMRVCCNGNHLRGGVID